MVRRTEAKTTALVLVIFAMLTFIVQCIGGIDTDIYGLKEGCTLSARLTYSFLHANALHLIANAWCLLSLVFQYNMSNRQIVYAFLIAVFCPVDLFRWTIPTVGLSAMCFALFGIMSFNVKKKIYYNSCIVSFIIIGLFVPNVNAWIHLYSYVAGLIVGFLNAPLFNGK